MCGKPDEMSSRRPCQNVNDRLVVRKQLLSKSVMIMRRTMRDHMRRFDAL
jgi:hypothetical protein